MFFLMVASSKSNLTSSVSSNSSDSGSVKKSSISCVISGLMSPHPKSSTNSEELSLSSPFSPSCFAICFVLSTNSSKFSSSSFFFSFSSSSSSFPMRISLRSFAADPAFSSASETSSSEAAAPVCPATAPLFSFTLLKAAAAAAASRAAIRTSFVLSGFALTGGSSSSTSSLAQTSNPPLRDMGSDRERVHGNFGMPALLVPCTSNKRRRHRWEIV
mmetsp:Transcript_2006/g.6076  ORF Transcript_2006/g.6076 Transcript_2006/m.6076 type:complete len:216 (-) Transcript_2006:68-715(-)